MQKVTGFVVAYKDWAAAGFPRRSPEWVQEIFDICKTCPLYNPEGKTPFGSVGTCEKCGCHVSNDPEDMLNKIVLPNTSCPLDPPRWNASVGHNQDPPAWAKLKRRKKNDEDNQPPLPDP